MYGVVCVCMCCFHIVSAQVDDAVMKLVQDGIVQMDTDALSAETKLRCLTISTYPCLFVEV